VRKATYCRCRPAVNTVTGDHCDATEFAEGAKPGQPQAGQDRRPHDRQADAEKHIERATPQSSTATIPKQGRWPRCCDDQKRPCDENFGKYDSGKAVGQCAGGNAADGRAIADEEQAASASLDWSSCPTAERSSRAAAEPSTSGDAESNRHPPVVVIFAIWELFGSLPHPHRSSCR
jgi:hypothetical protein